MTAMPQLPLELILQIVEATLPNRDPELIFDPAQHGGQTLLSFCLVCRATYGLATRLLRQHCVYINSKDRLRRLCISMKEEAAAAAASSSCASSSGTPAQPLLPATAPRLAHIENMFLAPFPGTLNDRYTAHTTSGLLEKLSGSLRRLVVDFPFDTLRPYDDDLGVRIILRQGLAQPRVLEELVDLSNAPDAFTHTVLANMVSRRPRPWPRLRRLGLYQPHPVQGAIWRGVAGLRTLEEVVMVQTSGWVASPGGEGWNVKRMVCGDWWTGEVPEQQQQQQGEDGDEGEGNTVEGEEEEGGLAKLGGDSSFARPLRITFADLRGVLRHFDVSRWGEYDPEELLSVFTYDMREGDIPVEAMYPSRAWMRRAVLRCSESGDDDDDEEEERHTKCSLPPSLWALEGDSIPIEA